MKLSITLTRNVSFNGYDSMNKEKSLTFLQSCIEKVKKATEQDIQFYKEVYYKEDILMDVESNGIQQVYDKKRKRLKQKNE